MLDWNDVRYFVAVAETGSTLVAGRRIGVSQTTAARRIAAIEAELAVSLFDRRSSGYRLTEQGEALLPIARNVAEQAERLSNAAQASVRDASGTVRLTMPEIYSVTIFSPMLRDLHQAYPKIRIELDTTDEVRDLANAAADMALRSCVRPVGGGLVGRRVATDNWGVYCSSSYAAKYGRPQRRRELAGHTIVGGGEPGIRTYYRKWIERNGLADAVIMDHDTSIGILSSVRSGVGIAALPCLVADNEPDLVRCLPPEPDKERGIWLLTHESARQAPKIRATLDFIADQFVKLRSRTEP